jgi:hypothetical protein
MALNELVEETLATLAAKQAAFAANAASFHTLAIGSSHGNYAFDPGRFPGAFNFCSTSQDLKHAAMIYGWCAGQAPHLRDIVLFYSVFSPGFYLEKSSEKQRCAVFKALFSPGTPYASHEINSIFAEVQEVLPTYVPDIAAAGDAGFVRSNDRYFFPWDYGADQRAADHMKHNARGGADIYLLMILDMAQQFGHRVTVVLPPVHGDYKNHLRATTQDIFRTIVELKTHFRYDFGFVNFFDDREFYNHDFGDYDHLLPEGPGPKIVTDALALALRPAEPAA